MSKYLVIKGAREHNLKNIDVKIKKGEFVVITGVSGSGKSSLAFDTIYAEGQRRYVESLSAYARQFLGQMEKPEVDHIDGLSPAIAIEQKTTSKNPRSTVGTITEIYDYLRLLYARCGTPYCWKCGKEMTSQSIDQILDEILKYKEGTKLQILSPVVRGRKGEYKKELNNIKKNGFVRVRIDGEIKDISDDIKLQKNKKHSISIIIDRIVIKKDIRERLADSIETALKFADGIVTILYTEPGNEEKEKHFSENIACIDCGTSIDELHPRIFSFNSPQGACSECHGLGEKKEFDIKLIAPDFSLSINKGALKNHKALDKSSWNKKVYEALALECNFSLDTPLKDLPQDIIDIIFYGIKKSIKIKYKSKDGESFGEWKHNYEGIIPSMQRRYRETTSDSMKKFYESFMTEAICPQCKGKRLKDEILSIKIENTNIMQINEMPVEKALQFFKEFKLEGNKKEIAEKILKEIIDRLTFLNNTGLPYITLDRKAGTLSGGESQRIRLATQIGSQLVGVIYVLDEPSIGLHQRDNEKLINTLKHLRNIGNTLIVVEHDEQTILESDYILDLGPGAGIHGGDIVDEGTPEQIIKNNKSLTAKYLSGTLKIEIPKKISEGNGSYIEVIGGCLNNLKNVNVKFPLGKFICVTGVSGSGKSTLINQVLLKALKSREYNGNKEKGYKEIKGYENIDKIINIDQSPIGRTPRSNPATYTGVFTYIREIFANLPEAKIKGYSPGRFSFNVKGGRCETCSGDGTIKIEMHFLPDIYVTCEICKGKRYNRETLEVKYKDKNIADVLNMTVEEALEFFENIPKIKNKLKTLNEVGLGYIKLGQSATTLSGGESQRIKLATELSKRSTGKTLYMLDEPTTGLHFDDVKKLVKVLKKFSEKGNTVLVIEHNLEVIKIADHIIDLGPEGGDSGGTIIVSGNPQEVINCEKSYTGQYLAEIMKENIQLAK